MPWAVECSDKQILLIYIYQSWYIIEYAKSTDSVCFTMILTVEITNRVCFTMILTRYCGDNKQCICYYDTYGRDIKQYMYYYDTYGSDNKQCVCYYDTYGRDNSVYCIMILTVEITKMYAVLGYLRKR